jgi:uncharacterized protein (TIGR02453 family)
MQHLTYPKIQFLKQLSQNNNSEWFSANKKLYENEIKLPFEQLIEDVIKKVSELEKKPFPYSAKQCIFRLNRDVRFSKNKEPYKTHLSALISYYGKKSNYPGLYIHLSWDKIMIGGGCYILDKSELYKIRDSIDYHIEEFNAIIEAEKFKNIFRQIQGDRNKIIPAEFKTTFEKQPLIANKQFYVMRELDSNEYNYNNIFNLIIETYDAMLPLNTFFNQALSNIED